MKKRLDLLLVEKGMSPSREQAKARIMAGAVTVDGQVEDKPGTAIDEAADIRLAVESRFVSRGGLKLEHALDAFGLDVSGKVAVDVGASTGGFTDCLLQRGASRVYAVDVGYGQLDWKLRNDPRVVVMERVNVRYLESLPERPSIATIDASFISLKLVIPPTARLLAEHGQIVALIKPQFEAGRGRVGKGGVVRDPAVHEEVLRKFAEWCGENAYGLLRLDTSPIRGPAGNVEFLGLVSPGHGSAGDLDAQISLVLAVAREMSARTSEGQ